MTHSYVELLSTCVNILLSRGLNGSPIERREAQDLVDAIRESGLLPPTLRLSIDLLAEDGSTWEVAATTDSRTETGRRYDLSEGLTGWLFRNRRAELYAASTDALPSDWHPVEGYQDLQAALVLALEQQRTQVGVICLVCDSSDGIPSELEAFVRRLRSEVNLLTNSADWEGWHRRRPSDGASLIFVTDEGPLDWLSTRVARPGWPYVDYWRWNPEKKALYPQPVSAELRAAGTGHLRPLALGEGFAGNCALSLRTLVEQQVISGRGVESGVATPLSVIRKGIPLRSILAVPISDAHRLYGVITVLSDKTGFFSPSDVQQAETIAAELSHREQGEAKKLLSELERSVQSQLLECLAQTSSPAEFWPKLSGPLKRLVRAGIVDRALLLIGNVREPKVYSCKSVAGLEPLPTRAEMAGIDAERDPLLKTLIRLPEGHAQAETWPSSEYSRVLLAPGATEIFIKRHSIEDRIFPTMVALASRGARDRYTRHGTESVEGALDSIFASVFSTTRAVLTAADHSTLKTRQAKLMALQTHAMRQPISNIRNHAEWIDRESQDASAKAHALRIISEADQTLHEMDNVLYEAGAVGPKSSPSGAASRVSVALGELVSEVVAAARARSPDQTIAYSQQEGISSLRVWGSRQYLSQAIANLLDNAVKYGRRAPIEVRVNRARDGWVRLRVVDHGIGIPDSDLKSIFDPEYESAYRVRFDVTGKHIGLSVSRKIVEEHNGKLWMESAGPQKGATAFVELPVYLKEDER